jgi:hypothetical protein
MQDIKPSSTEEQVKFRPIATTDSIARKHDGTVQLTSDHGIILIPTPSADPRDPLNISLWHKLVILSTTCLCEFNLAISMILEVVY